MKLKRRALPLILVSLSLIPAGQARQSPGQTAPPAPAAATREVSVAVVDRQERPVGGLWRGDFALYDGKERREIVSFADADVPATVGVLLDVSGSMKGRRTRAVVRGALLRFFADCNPSDEFFLIAFNQGVQLLLDATSDPHAVIAALDRYGAAAESGGQTALFDALYLALNRAARGRHARRALLLVTDGEDNASRYTFNEVRRALRESDVIAYSVTPVGVTNGMVELDRGGRAALRELTDLSGGAAFYAWSEEGLHGAMAKVAAQIRRRYTLGFVPAPAARADGWHELKIRLAELRDGRGKKIEPVVRARPGFYDTSAARGVKER